MILSLIVAIFVLMVLFDMGFFEAFGTVIKWGLMFLGVALGVILTVSLSFAAVVMIIAVFMDLFKVLFFWNT